MKLLPTQIIIILVCGILLGAINNTVSPNKIPWVQDYNTKGVDDDDKWMPFSWDPTQDTVFTLLGINRAYQEFEKGEAIFIDARLLDEYEEGHIAGAINVDFEGEADVYNFQIEELQRLASTDAYLITYCAGTECDASLMLARNLYFDLGYKNIAIFFGGWEQWTEKDYPIETGIN